MTAGRGPAEWLVVLVVSLCLLMADVISRSAHADPSIIGQSGLIHMPDARLGEDGLWRFGVSHTDPYLARWGSVSALPRLELSGRYTTFQGVPAFGGGTGFGDVKDKAFDAKLLLVREGRFLPQVSFGIQDYTGTGLFNARFAALSKRFADVDLTIGYGEERIDGLFGGLRYSPSWHRNLGLVVEYDANAYARDFSADQSGAAERAAGITYGLEYRYGWLGAQLSYQDGEPGINVYVSVPLMRREFIPKIEEPAPYARTSPPPALEAWNSEPHHARELTGALEREGFTHVRVTLEGRSVEARVTNTRISRTSRAVGRAARVLLLAGPRDLESITVIYVVNDLPMLTYHFRDTGLLRAYYSGTVSLDELEASIEVTQAPPGDLGHPRRTLTDETSGPDRTDYDRTDDEPPRLQLVERAGRQGGFDLAPVNLGIYLNDHNGAFRYELFSLIGYRKRLGEALFLSGAARLTLLENISEVTRPSDSLLPHVRSDVAEYRKGRYLRLNSLLLNRYFYPRERLIGRLSLGYYEEMFAGGGGQVLYLPRQGDWAVDLAVDRLQQRETDGGFGFRDYSVTTVLGSAHYHWPRSGLTTTLRAGRFLAGDKGVRYEVKRRFRSGVEIGGWYTVTDGRDITGPGRPGSPYHDKGIFISVPLSSMLTTDTRERANLALSPWTRDVGQMVVSPGDLYRLVERTPVAGSEKQDFFSDFNQ